MVVDSHRSLSLSPGFVYLVAIGDCFSSAGEGGFVKDYVVTTSFTNFTVLPGALQNTPILPGNGGSFSQVPARRWFDPPLAQGYTFTAAGTGLFKQIMAFPVGIPGSYYVTTEGATYGPYSPQESVDLETLRGHGVSNFVLKGIKPFVDATSPVAFPIMLDFTQPTADFTMVPIAAPDLQMVTLPNGDLQFTFDGVLQSSPDLTNWTDVTPTPTSPHVIPKAQIVGARFFRSRDP